MWKTFPPHAIGFSHLESISRTCKFLIREPLVNQKAFPKHWDKSASSLRPKELSTFVMYCSSKLPNEWFCPNQSISFSTIFDRITSRLVNTSCPVIQDHQCACYIGARLSRDIHLVWSVSIINKRLSTSADSRSKAALTWLLKRFH